MKWEDFFLDFIKGLLLQLFAEKHNLNICTLCLRDQSVELSFRIRLVDKLVPPFSRVFNAEDNLKAIRATYSFLGLNENFTKLKIGVKACFDMSLKKYFATNFTFNESAGIKSP